MNRRIITFPQDRAVIVMAHAVMARCPPRSWTVGVFIVAIVLACQPRVRQFAALTFKLSPVGVVVPSNCPSGTTALNDATCQSVERAEGDLICVANSTGRFAIDAAPQDRQGRTAATPAGCRQRCQKTSGCHQCYSFSDGSCHISTGPAGTRGRRMDTIVRLATVSGPPGCAMSWRCTLARTWEPAQNRPDPLHPCHPAPVPKSRAQWVHLNLASVLGMGGDIDVVLSLWGMPRCQVPQLWAIMRGEQTALKPCTIPDSKLTKAVPPPSMPPHGAAAPLQPTLWRDITRLDDSLKLLTRPERERLLVSTSIEFDTVSAADFCKDYESVGITSRAWGMKCGLVSHLKAWNAPAKPTTALLGLLRTRGLRTVVFFGDSVGQQYFAALIQMLARDGSSCQDADGWIQSTRGWAGVVAGNQSSRLLPPDNPPYSKCGNVPYVAQVRCDGVVLVQIGMYPHTWAKGSDLLQIVTTHLWENVDAIVFNSGLHSARGGYGAALKHWLPMLQHFGARDGKLAIFRETSAQHFESVTGAYEDRNLSVKRCSSSPAGEEFGHPLNRMLWQAVRPSIPARSSQDSVVADTAPGYPAIYISRFGLVTQDRFDTHITTNSKGALDCTHFCWSPIFWQGVFSSLYDEVEEFTS